VITDSIALPLSVSGSRGRELENLKILHITGSFPPTPCGVGDYLSRLKKSLEKSSLNQILFSKKSWGLPTLFQFREVLKQEKPQIVHLQYPTTSFRASLIPFLCLLLARKNGARTLLTLHEYSEAHLLRRIALQVFSRFTHHLIFTSHFERERFLKLNNKLNPPHSIIHIGSNILPLTPPLMEKEERILLFGLIRPGKGIESFIQLARLAHQQNLDYEFTLIGQIPDGEREYAGHIRHLMADLPRLSFFENLSASDASRYLSTSKYAYLIYPDGASFRRGSLLACLFHNITVFTNKGRQTPSEMSRVCYQINSPHEALKYLALKREKKIDQLFLEQFTWDHIANRHVEEYLLVLK
jgi:glycosyltransferase involved in cell wall biosynthesis